MSSDEEVWPPKKSVAVPVPITANTIIGWLNTDDDSLPFEPYKQQPNRLVGCSFSQLQFEIDKLTDAGMEVHLYPLNISRLPGGASAIVESIYENRNNSPGANFDVQESKKEKLWIAGHAEITSIASNAFEIADLIFRSSKKAVVISSLNGGDAMKTLTACTANALRTIDKKKAKLAIRGRTAQPKDPKLKKFVEAFSTFSRQNAVSKTEAFYYAEL